MQPPHRAKLNQWFQEQLESFRDQGVDEESLEDPIVRTLIYEVSLRKHYREVQAEPGLFDVVFLELFKLVSPRELHELSPTRDEVGRDGKKRILFTAANAGYHGPRPSGRMLRPDSPVPSRCLIPIRFHTSLRIPIHLLS